MMLINLIKKRHYKNSTRNIELFLYIIDMNIAQIKTEKRLNVGVLGSNWRFVFNPCPSFLIEK